MAARGETKLAGSAIYARWGVVVKFPSATVAKPRRANDSGSEGVDLGCGIILHKLRIRLNDIMLSRYQHTCWGIGETQVASYGVAK